METAAVLEVLPDPPPRDLVEEWVDLRNEVDPANATTPDLIEATQDDPYPIRRVSGRSADGSLVAAARAVVSSTGRTANIDIWRRPAATDELATRIADDLEAWLDAFGSVEKLSTWTYDHDEVGVRFWHDRGWTEGDRRIIVGRDVASSPVRPVPELPGLELVTLAERHDLARATHDTWNESWATTPWAVDDLPEFELWWRNIELLPGIAPDQFLMAVDGDVVAGYTTMDFGTFPSTAEVWHAYTGVRSTHRRRGIATALKLWAIEWARERGIGRILTANDEGNDAMRAINDALGYEPAFAYVTFERGAPDDAP